MQKTLAVLVLAAGFIAIPAGAQGRGRGKHSKVPPGHLPRAGECRVWYDGRPPGHQPPPTSCGEARREAYETGGRVIYGGGRRDDDRYYDREDRDRDRDRDRYCDERDRREGDCRYYPDGRQPYPGYPYPDSRYPDSRYPDSRYPDTGYPRSLPDMVWGVIFKRGQATNQVRQWVGPGDVRSSITDSDRNRVPEVVNWYSAGGQLLQQWIDRNHDGRADQVGIYRNGRVTRVIR